MTLFEIYLHRDPIGSFEVPDQKVAELWLQ
jgi:hypothetical protein